MIDDAFVIDAIKHSHNLHPSNYAFAKHAKPIAEAVAQGLFSTSPLGTQLPQESYQRDWRIEDTAHTTFLESDVDMAVHQVLPIAAFKDGLDSLEKNVEAQRRWPDRFILYAGVDPMQGQKAMEELERQVEVLRPVGLKLYPHTWVSGEPQGWLMDDPEIAYPFFERSQKLGLKIVAIHKAVPMGPVPLQYYHVEDVDRAALAFPDIGLRDHSLRRGVSRGNGLAAGPFPQRLRQPRDHQHVSGQAAHGLHSSHGGTAGAGRGPSLGQASLGHGVHAPPGQPGEVLA